MTFTSSIEISNGRGTLVKPSSLTHLAAGTMVSLDLEGARKLYEDFLGLEAVYDGPDKMFLRDRRSKYLMEKGERDFFVIEVHEVEDVEKPQKMLNHWGISVGTHEEVKRIYDLAKAEKERWWIKKIRPITELHESYGFYFIDMDDNWWEIEHRGGATNDTIFSQGDFDNRTTDGNLMSDPPLDIGVTMDAVVGPEAFLTHGTVDVVQVANARNFYEEVLGLRSVLRFENAQFTAGGGDFAFVGVQVGNHVGLQQPDNRWVLLVENEAELEMRHRNALALREKYGIRQVTDMVQDDDGNLLFLIESADSNWFEFSNRPGKSYIKKFG